MALSLRDAFVIAGVCKRLWPSEWPELPCCPVPLPDMQARSLGAPPSHHCGCHLSGAREPHGYDPNGGSKLQGKRTPDLKVTLPAQGPLTKVRWSAGHFLLQSRLVLLLLPGHLPHCPVSS